MHQHPSCDTYALEPPATRLATGRGGGRLLRPVVIGDGWCHSPGWALTYDLGDTLVPAVGHPPLFRGVAHDIAFALGGVSPITRGTSPASAAGH
jgi:hypothetical protein